MVRMWVTWLLTVASLIKRATAISDKHGSGGGARSSYFGPPVEPKFRAIRGRLRVAGDDA